MSDERRPGQEKCGGRLRTRAFLTGQAYVSAMNSEKPKVLSGAVGASVRTHTWTLNEAEPVAKGEFSGHGILTTYIKGKQGIYEYTMVSRAYDEGTPSDAGRY